MKPIWMQLLLRGGVGCVTFLLVTLIGNMAHAQVVPVHAIGGSFSQVSDSIAVAKSIDHYHRAALTIARRPPKGMIAFEIEKPKTTIYPNEDGSFDAVSNGLVRFMPFKFDDDPPQAKLENVQRAVVVFDGPASAIERRVIPTSR